MKTLACILVLGASLASPSGAQQAPFTLTAPAPAGFDRALAQRATQEHLTRLIGLDTQNPPGNEMRTARYFDSVFAQIPGVERHILESAPGRANFIARLRATRARSDEAAAWGFVAFESSTHVMPSARPTTRTSSRTSRSGASGSRCR